MILNILQKLSTVSSPKLATFALELKLDTPSVFKYKQILTFKFIQLMMYAVYIINHIHH